MIETPRLRIRDFSVDDVEELHRIHRQSEVMQFSGGLERFPDKDATNAYIDMRIEQKARLGFTKWAVEERETGLLVGRVGFSAVQRFAEPELGWLLAREQWGKGYATEAAKACLEYGFHTLNMPSVISIIDIPNQASIRVAERIGERLREETVVDGLQVFVFGIDRA